MKNIFQTAGAIKKIQTKEDKTLKLTIDTQELNPTESTMLFSLFDKLGWFIFKELPIDPQDIKSPEFVAEIKGEKSPSKRLKNVLFVLWKQNGSNRDFDDYYKKQIEKFIEAVKDKLD